MKYWTAYASRYGSSADVAQRIAGSLGCEAVDVAGHGAQLPANTDALAIGGPTYGGLLYRPLRDFLDRHQREILGVPRVGVFVLGLQSGLAAERQLADAVPAWLSVHASIVVSCGGRSDPARMRATDRLLLRVVGGHAGVVDRLNLEAVDQLVATLQGS